MKILLQLASLMFLSLLSCADMPSSSVMPLSDTPANALSVSSPYLEEDNSPFDRCLNEATTAAELSVKSVFKERFDIPELVTDDVDENEKELQFILESFSKFSANPDHVYQALKAEFLNGNNFKTLLPNLMRYFDRYQPNRDKRKEFEILIQNDKYDYLFTYAPEFLKELEKAVSGDCKLRPAFQEYISANPEHLERAKELIGCAMGISRRWFKVALVSNMPMNIFTVFPIYYEYIFEAPCIFTGIFIAKEYHPEIFEKINYLIDNAYEEHRKNEYRLYNLVRYGPEDPDVLNNIPANTKYNSRRLCHCASLANKMDLFYKLLPSSMTNIISYIHNLRNAPNNVNSNDCLEMHKFIFDVHANSDLYNRQSIYKNTEFLRIVKRYYRVVYIKLDGNDITMHFKIANEADTSKFTERLFINYQSVSMSELAYFPEMFIFDSAELLEGYLVDLFNAMSILKAKGQNCSQITLNAENLNFVMKSESIRRVLNYNIENSLVPRKPFIVLMDSYMKVNDDEFDFPVTDIAILNNRSSIHFKKLKTADQIRKFEVLLKLPLSTFIRPEDDYFELRNVFKYLIENGKELPKNLSERTRELLEIDFPGINLS